MYAQVEKPKENKSRAVENSVAQTKSKERQGFGFLDNRPETFAQRKLQAMANNHIANQQLPLQKKENNAGLFDNWKSGIENLYGFSMDDVKVHYNSDKPAQMQAHAYAQGTDFHIDSEQEKYLPHEAWHVIQQKQGRVQPTLQMKRDINDDVGLEKEADIMGAKALNSIPTSNTILKTPKIPSNVKQFVIYQNETLLWQAVEPDTSIVEIRKIIDGNSELKKAYEDSLLNLNRMNFVNSPGTQPEASYAQNHNATYNITYGLRTTQNGTFKDVEKFIGAIIHEMGHVNSGLQYTTNVPQGEVYHVANMHLPAARAPYFGNTQVGENQRNDPATGWEVQRVNMEANWNQLQNLRTNDNGFIAEESDYLNSREDYAKGTAPEAHYDTVLVDILYYLQYHGLTETHYYLQATAMLQEANNRRRAGNGIVPLVALVPQPANDFLRLYNDVRTLLLDPLWEREGEAFFGKKTPSGVKQMKASLNNATKRMSLNKIQEIASAKIRQPDNKRSKSTSELYEALSKVNQRSDFGQLIAEINLCKLWLGQDKKEAIELT